MGRTSTAFRYFQLNILSSQMVVHNAQKERLKKPLSHQQQLKLTLQLISIRQSAGSFDRSFAVEHVFCTAILSLLSHLFFDIILDRHIRMFKQ